MTEGRQPAPAHRLSVSPHCRVIVDNDYQGDPDGLVALAHHLLSPANRVTAITSSFLNPRFPAASPRAADGAALAHELLEVAGCSPRPPVYAGSEHPFGGRSGSAASDAIVQEARKDDGLPLYLACGGPLTNVASALRDAPDIASRLTLIWIGGSLDGSAFEYNRDTDPAAAAFVFGQQGLEIHQFPVESSAATLLSSQDSPRARRRVYTDLDFRLIVADMLARFRLHERQRPTQEGQL